ncbi:HDR142Wp [Eremothecium sinecaudum]|uniref:HDR142Wp n=1 Tax=Eremothecium sinecaudum TaxID=45286 RepID=A0A0X8HSZ1_9SACH|nr:HDR142Wp [Eremothecium sinecaudum]AMD20884.1 HDR142Wp [Eremothecium sinecaudum]
MSNNLENLRSRIVANMNGKRGDKPIPTGPSGSNGGQDRNEGGSGAGGGPWSQENMAKGSQKIDPRRGGMRGDFTRGAGSGPVTGRRSVQQTSSNTMPLGAPSRFGGMPTGPVMDETRRGPHMQQQQQQQQQPDVRRMQDSRWNNHGGRYGGSRYGKRFDSAPARIEKQPNRYSGYEGGSRLSSSGGRGPARKPRAVPGSPYARDWTPDFRSIDWSKVPSIDERVRTRPTKWDVTPKGFEKVPAERAKLSGLFPLPGQPQALDRTTLDGIAEKGELNRRTKILFEDPTKHNLAQCKLNRTLIITSMELGFTDQERVANEINRHLSRVTFEDKFEVEGWKAKGNHLVLQLNSEGATTLVLASKTYLERSIGLQFVWQRPGEYVARIDTDESICNRFNIALLDVPVERAEEVPTWMTERGIEYTWLYSLELTDGDERTFAKAVLYTPAANQTSSSILEGLTALKPNDSQLALDFSGISYQTFSKVAAAQVHKPSRVVCLLNAVDPVDLKNERYYQEIHDAMMFGTPVTSCGAVESIKIPIPSPDYRNNFATIPLQVGKVFIKFTDIRSAERAMLTLAGMRFGERTIICSYFSERDFDLDLI